MSVVEKVKQVGTAAAALVTGGEQPGTYMVLHAATGAAFIDGARNADDAFERWLADHFPAESHDPKFREEARRGCRISRRPGGPLNKPAKLKMAGPINAPKS